MGGAESRSMRNLILLFHQGKKSELRQGMDIETLDVGQTFARDAEAS